MRSRFTRGRDLAHFSLCKLFFFVIHGSHLNISRVLERSRDITCCTYGLVMFLWKGLMGGCAVYTLFVAVDEEAGAISFRRVLERSARTRAGCLETTSLVIADLFSRGAWGWAF